MWKEIPLQAFRHYAADELSSRRQTRGHDSYLWLALVSAWQHICDQDTRLWTTIPKFEKATRVGSNEHRREADVAAEECQNSLEAPVLDDLPALIAR